MSRVFRIALLTATSLLVLVAPDGARAANVTIGSPLTATFAPESTGFASGTTANVVLPEAGAHVTSPVTGAIVAWHLLDAKGGPFALRVLHPASPGSLATVTATGTSAPVIPTTMGFQTYATALPITAGDLIGIDTSNATDEIGALTAGGEVGVWEPKLGEGVPTALTIPAPVEIAFDAEVQPAPTITSISPTSTGFPAGEKVTILGTDLEGATAVNFGTGPALGFTVNSEGSITAVAPTGAGSVPISVTTIAGTATSAQVFTFGALVAPLTVPTTCTVPKLKHTTLKASKKKIRAADCKVGKLVRRKGATARTGKVVHQSRRPGSVVPAGTKIVVVLGD